MTKDFKKFIIHVGDWESSNMQRGVARVKQENASEVRISWATDLRTPDPVMQSRAIYVFTRFAEIDEEFLSIEKLEKGIRVTRRDGLGFGEEISPVVPEVVYTEEATNSTAVEEQGIPSEEPVVSCEAGDAVAPSDELSDELETVSADTAIPVPNTGTLIAETSETVEPASTQANSEEVPS